MWFGKTLVCGVLLFTSCSLLSFETYELSCSLSEDERYFDDEEISLVFPVAVKKELSERQVSLLCNKSPAQLNFTWESDSALSLAPVNGWEIGKKYELTASGTFISTDGSSLALSTKRNFTYGKEGDIFSLIDFTKDLVLEGTAPIRFVFSESLSPSSFAESFSISPAVRYEYFFSEDFCTVDVFPKEPWPLNTQFEWSISESLESARKIHLNKNESAVLSSFVDLDMPELLSFVPCIKNEGDIIMLKENVLEDIADNDGIAFSFSKPMRFESVRECFSITPSVSGDIYSADKNLTSFAFIPSEPWQADKRYKVKISKSAQDYAGLSMYEDSIAFFTPAISYVNVLSVKADSLLLRDQEINFIPQAERLSVTLLFSEFITEKERTALEKGLSLSLLFPLSARNPLLEEVAWSLMGESVTLTWCGFSDSSNSAYYELLVSCKDLFKEDICFVLCMQ